MESLIVTHLFDGLVVLTTAGLAALASLVNAAYKDVMVLKIWSEDAKRKLDEHDKKIDFLHSDGGASNGRIVVLEKTMGDMAMNIRELSASVKDLVVLTTQTQTFIKALAESSDKRQTLLEQKLLTGRTN